MPILQVGSNRGFLGKEGFEHPDQASHGSQVKKRRVTKKTSVVVSTPYALHGNQDLDPNMRGGMDKDAWTLSMATKDLIRREIKRGMDAPSKWERNVFTKLRLNVLDDFGVGEAAAHCSFVLNMCDSTRRG